MRERASDGQFNRRRRRGSRAWPECTRGRAHRGRHGGLDGGGGGRGGSGALRGDAACAITCAYMAGMLPVGLALSAGFGWWWADGLAALALLYWLVPEAGEALEGARAGRAGCACGGDDCRAD